MGGGIRPGVKTLSSAKVQSLTLNDIHSVAFCTALTCSLWCIHLEIPLLVNSKLSNNVNYVSKLLLFFFY